MNSDILGAGIGHLERSSTVPADHNTATCWVGVAYIVRLGVCVRYMVVCTCAEVANRPPARVVKGVRLVQVVVLCVVVSCCSSVVSCGGLAFRNAQVHSYFPPIPPPPPQKQRNANL